MQVLSVVLLICVAAGARLNVDSHEITSSGSDEGGSKLPEEAEDEAELNPRVVVLSREGLTSIEDVFQFLPSKTLFNVQELDLSLNNISVLSNSILQRMENLRLLVLSKNPVKVVHDLSSASLDELYLSDVHLHYLRQSSLRNLTRLRVLDISYNKKFSSLYRDGDLVIPLLEHLNASHCSLTKIALGRLTNLTRIDFSNNAIEKITQDTFENNTRLERINLSHNKIQHMDHLTFVHNWNLTELNLSFNLLKQLSWTSGLKNVLKLNLRHNKIESTMDLRLEQVRYLDLSKNVIEILTEDLDETCPNLVQLNLQSNRIRHIRKLKSRSLNSLNLRDCKITVIQEGALNETGNLEELDISDNKIKNIVFVLLVNTLRNLTLSENLLECECTDLVQMTVANNSDLTSDLTCGELTWDQYCAMQEVEWEAEKEALREADREASRILAEKTAEEVHRGHALGWSIGLCLFCLTTVLGYTAWRYWKNKKLEQDRSGVKEELTPANVDLLEPTKAVSPKYQYIYVEAPELEEVQLRHTVEYFVAIEDEKLHEVHLNDK